MDQQIQDEQKQKLVMRSKQEEHHRPFRILFVDDDEEFLEAMTQQLNHDLNCHVVQAMNPYEAMNLLVDSYFDLVIIDWKLQSMSGWSALQKTDEALRIDTQISPQWGKAKVPVILISADPLNETRSLASSHFQKIGFLSKLQNAHQMSEGIRQLIEKKKLKAS